VNNYTRDYILMKNVFHCSPAELDKLTEEELDVYFNIYNLDIEAQNIIAKREEQKMKNKM